MPSPDNWENKILKATEGSALVPIVLLVVAIVTLLVSQHMHKQPKKNESWTKEVAASKASKDGKSPSTGPLKNIWEERRRNGSTKAEIQRTDSDGKPFGSSYYYAHNSLRKTGGYTDGLKMEDYQMGTPRLLSKGAQQPETTGESADTNVPEDPTLPPSKRIVSPKDPSCTPITKYLWDDPGDHKAVGTIRIDQLADDLSWRDADVEDIQLDLKDETCLKVVVRVKEGKFYRLHIPKLYGKVQEVKKVSKTNRLLIRLYKRNKHASTGEIDAQNIKSWPTPYKNKAA